MPIRIQKRALFLFEFCTICVNEKLRSKNDFILDGIRVSFYLGTAEPLVKQFRFSKYLLLTSVKSLFVVLFIPFFINIFTKIYIFRPLVEYFWDTKQTEIFLNYELQEKAFTEIRNFEEKIYFDYLLKTSEGPFIQGWERKEEFWENESFPSQQAKLVFSSNLERGSSSFFLSHEKRKKEELFFFTTSSLFSKREAELLGPLQNLATERFEETGTSLNPDFLTLPKIFLKEVSNRNDVGHVYLSNLNSLSSSFPRPILESPKIGGLNTVYKSGPSWQTICVKDDFFAQIGTVFVQEPIFEIPQGVYGTKPKLNNFVVFESPTRSRIGHVFDPIMFQVVQQDNSFSNRLVLRPDPSKKIDDLGPSATNRSSKKSGDFCSQQTSRKIYVTGKTYFSQNLRFFEPAGKTYGLGKLKFSQNPEPEPSHHRFFLANLDLSIPGGAFYFSKNTESIFRQKTRELAEHYNKESISALTNLLADFMGLIILLILLVNMKMSLMNTTAFLSESFFSLKDSKKAFLMLLFTDLLVGFHSPRGWEVIFHFLFEHFGLPENHNIIFLLVGTFPVLLDALFKYWIFRHLNRHSPATVATFQAMVE
uniref:Potassium/proton antiporter CemA n=1 Tax=Chaetophoropsis pisiformis TaxID=1675661 RepID=A0A6M3U8X7_9CHLO|nr:chloroplast enveloppe membrane protein [Chaetophoropsis pisiformis]